MKKVEFFLLSLILILAFSLRLYQIQRPIADWHSWRQADTAAVSRNFIKEGFNLIVPKYDDMSSQTNGLDNPNRYRFVEFPIYNVLVAAVWKITGIETVWARLTTVIISLGSTIFLYLLVKRFSGIKTGLLAAFFFAVIPYNVFYSSAILPGPFMVFSLLGLYIFFSKWMDENKNAWGILSIVFCNLAILSWPIAVFFMLPVIYLAFQKYGVGIVKQKKLWIFGFFSIAPFLGWRIWISNFPEGIPNWRFLINEDNIRFKGAFFRWLIAERIGKLILTVTGAFLFILGISKNPQNKEKLFYYSYLAAAILYFSIFASGNVRHDYYQVPFVPIASIFMAIGTKSLLESEKFFEKRLGKIIAIASIIFMVSLGYYEVRGYYWINKPQIIEAGKAVDRLLPQDAKVIAPYNGDTAFLYQTNRYGYPIVDRPLEKFIDQGTKYLVSVDVQDSGIQNLARHCKVIEKTEKYVIVEMFAQCIGK